MTEKLEKPLSPTMRSALQAVARMKRDAAPDATLWAEFQETLKRFAGEEAEPQEIAKPAGR